MFMAPHAHQRRGLSLVAALALASSSVAMAAPAVTTRNTTVRSAPFKVAPVIKELEPGAQVSADEEATNGWRRVELSGGKFGYVPDVDVKIDPTWVKPVAPKPAPVVAAPPAEPAPAAAAAEAPAASTPEVVQPIGPVVRDGRTVQYVTDLSHLAEAVKSDPEVFAMADGLATRKIAAGTVVGVGVLGGLALRLLAETALQSESCVIIPNAPAPNAPAACATYDNRNLQRAGLALLVLGPLIGAALWPTRADQTRVVNAWNSKHPRRPFIDGAGLELP
jgi:hypothetical protein